MSAEKLREALAAASKRLGYTLPAELAAALEQAAPDCFVERKLEAPWDWWRVSEALAGGDYRREDERFGLFGARGVYRGPDGIALCRKGLRLFCLLESSRGSKKLEPRVYSFDGAAGTFPKWMAIDAFVRFARGDESAAWRTADVQELKASEPVEQSEAVTLVRVLRKRGAIEVRDAAAWLTLPQRLAPVLKLRRDERARALMHALVDASEVTEVGAEEDDLEEALRAARTESEQAAAER